jgi:hypothetical protein
VQLLIYSVLPSSDVFVIIIAKNPFCNASHHQSSPLHPMSLRILVSLAILRFLASIRESCPVSIALMHRRTLSLTDSPSIASNFSQHSSSIQRVFCLPMTNPMRLKYIRGRYALIPIHPIVLNHVASSDGVGVSGRVSYGVPAKEDRIRGWATSHASFIYRGCMEMSWQKELLT